MNCPAPRSRDADDRGRGVRRPWWWRARRLDGVEAVSWRSSVFTRHRTDLPFPSCPTPRLLRGVR